jgi:hypothetical protein
MADGHFAFVHTSGEGACGDSQQKCDKCLWICKFKLPSAALSTQFIYFTGSKGQYLWSHVYLNIPYNMQKTYSLTLGAKRISKMCQTKQHCLCHCVQSLLIIYYQILLVKSRELGRRIIFDFLGEGIAEFNWIMRDDIKM